MHYEKTDPLSRYASFRQCRVAQGTRNRAVFDDFESGNFSVLQNEGVADTQGSGLALWPNPAGNTLYLEGMDDETVSVYDNTGRLVLQERYAGPLNVSGLAPGLYVIAAGGRATRFVKE